MRRNTCDHGSKNHALGTGPKPEKDGFRRRHAVRYGDERIRRAVVSGASPLPLPARSTLYTQLALLFLYGNGFVSVAVLLGNLPQSAADQKQTPLRAGDSAARRAVCSLYRLSVHGLVLLLQRSGRVRSRTCILSPVCLKLRLRYSGFGHQPYRHDLEKDFRTKAGLRGNAVVRATAHYLRDIAILFSGLAYNVRFAYLIVPFDLHQFAPVANMFGSADRHQQSQKTADGIVRAYQETFGRQGPVLPFPRHRLF